MVWLWKTMWNQYTDSTGGKICTQNKGYITWTKYQLKVIISYQYMCHRPKQSMLIMHIEDLPGKIYIVCRLFFLI